MTSLQIYSRFLLVAIIWIILSGHITDNQVIRKEYKILNNSLVRLEVCSNVRNFTCDCEQSFPKANFELQKDKEESIGTFKNVAVKLKTTNLDCGNYKINHDMLNTLKSDEFPYITLQLKRVRIPHTFQPHESQTLSVDAVFSIAGETRYEKLIVKVQKVKANQYRFICRKKLKMSNFNLKPKSAFLGLVRVEDQITLNFKLYVEVD